MAFDNDEILDDNDDEDLKNDPVSQMDMQVSVQSLLRNFDFGFWCVVFFVSKAHLLSFLRECAAHNLNNFTAAVDELSPEEMLVVHQIVSGSNWRVCNLSRKYIMIESKQDPPIAVC